ncbi:hypothetical protein IAU59_002581 [Kwoniella sp. CBS 9459]
MAGPNLEIFKFGFYMFFPIYVMFKFGDPEWYESYVKPYKEVLWPPYESTYQPPRTHEGVQQELQRMKAERLARAQISQSQLAQRAATGEANVSASTSSEGVVVQPQDGAAVPPPVVKSGSGTGWGWPGTANANANASGNAERLV